MGMGAPTLAHFLPPASDGVASAVNADGQTVRIDPSWLREKTDSEPLNEVTLGGITNTERFSTYLWDRWYTYLRNRIEHRSFREFVGYVQRHNDDVDPDRYLLEARPLLEGTPVSVSGKVHVEQGEPILRGTSDTPLLISDAGFDSIGAGSASRSCGKESLLWPSLPSLVASGSNSTCRSPCWSLPISSTSGIISCTT